MLSNDENINQNSPLHITMGCPPHANNCPPTCQQLLLGHQFTCYICKCLLVVCGRDDFIIVLLSTTVSQSICFLFLVCNTY